MAQPMIAPSVQEPSSLFSPTLDGTLVANHHTPAQAHVLIGDVFAHTLSSKRLGKVRRNSEVPRSAEPPADDALQ